MNGFGLTQVGIDWLFVQFMGAGSLMDLFKRRVCLSWEDKLRITLEAAKGLDYLHRRELIHRDIKSTVHEVC